MSRSKITKFAFAIVLISFLLSTFVSLWSLNMMSERNKRELGKVLASRIYDSISGGLSEPVMVARTMANDSFLIELLKNEDSLSESVMSEKMQTYLSGIQEGLEYEAAFVISDASRRYYSFQGMQKTIDPENEARDFWYAEFLKSGQSYRLDVDNDEFSSDAWTVFVDARIKDRDGAILGVCGVGVEMDETRDTFRRLENEYRVKISLIDRNGLVQVDTDESRIENHVLRDVKLNSAGDYLYQKLSGQSFVVSKYIENLDWYLVVQSDGSAELEDLLNVILLNVGLCVFVMIIMTLAVRIIAMRTIALANASFRDQDTGLFNRRAFEEEKARLQHAALEEDFVYLTVDINGLKTANDTLGHAAGDELIAGAAACMEKCFGPYGKTYRIGGDEFAAMLNASEEQLVQIRENLDKAVAAWSGEKIKSLSISCGYASAKEFPSENLTELSRISDERMYEAKAEYYRKNGIERRRT